MNKMRKAFQFSLLCLSCLLLTALSSFSHAKDYLTIAIAPNYAPYTLVTPQGEVAGLTVDLWKLWAETEGVELEFRVLDWPDTLKAVELGSVDIHSGMFHNEERDALFDFSSPLAHIPSAIYNHYSEDVITKASDLQAKRVGVIKGTFQETYLKNKVQEATIVPLRNIEETARALIEGTVDAVFTETPAMTSELISTGYIGLVHSADQPFMTNHLLAGVRKGNSSLLERIEKGLANLDLEKAVKIEKRWLQNKRDRHFEHQADGVQLTEEEINWLQGKGQISIGVTTFINPVDIITENGEYIGLNADLLKEVSKILGIQILPERFERWPDMINAALSGQIDAVMNVSKTPEREKKLNFTRPYAYDPIITITRKNHRAVPNWKDLEGERVGALENSAMYADIASVLGKDKVKALKSDNEGLLSVKNGELDAYVTGLILFRNAQDQEDLSGLRIAGSKNVEGGALRIGAHNQVPFLGRVLQKALDVIPQKRMQEIRSKWLLGDEADQSNTMLKFLSEEELNWLKSHKKIRVHNEMEWAPFNFFDQGKAQGYSIDVMNLLAKKIGIEVEYISGPTWGRFLDMIRSKNLDVMLNIVQTPKREEFVNFTAPYIEVNPALVINDRLRNIQDLNDLSGKSLCMPTGFYYREIIESNYPQIKLTYKSNTPLCLQAVSIGEADALVENSSVLNHIMRKTVVSNVKNVGILSDPALVEIERIGVRKDWPILRDILDKTLATVTEAELTPLRNRWFGDIGTDLKTLGLTQKEAAWLRRNSVLRLGVDAAWAPFEFLDDDGEFSGISSDFVKEMEKRLNIAMEPQEGLSWNQVIEGIGNKEIDIIGMATPSEERRKTMLFTNPYVSFPAVLATKSNAGFISGLQDLSGKKLALVESYVTHEYVKKNFPEIELVLVENLGEAIEKVRDEEAFATMGNLAAITYITDLNQIHDIKIAAPTDLTFNLAMAVRKDWPELVKILNKALGSLTEEEKTVIKNRWVAVSYNFGTDFKTIMIWAIPITLGLGTIIIIIVISNRKLGAEVEERQKAEVRVREREAWFKSLLESMPDATIIANSDGIIQLINLQTEEIFGYDREELIGESVDILVPELHRPHHAGYRNNYASNPRLRQMGAGSELFAQRKDGSTFPVEISLSPIQSSEGVHIAASVRDITQRRVNERKLEFTQNAVDHAADPIFWVSPEDGSLEYVNVAASKVLGYDREKLLTMSVPDIDVNFSQDKLQHLAEQVSTEKFALFESELIDSDGLFIDVEITVYPADYHGHTLLIANVKDITERKKAEAALKEQEERIRLLIESVGEGIIGVDKLGHVSFINTVACETLGYENHELLGKKVHGIIHHTRPDGSEYPVETCPMWEAYTYGNAARIDDEVLWTKAGDPVDVEYHATPLRKDGEVIGAVIAFRDVSEMVKLTRNFVSLLENSTDYIYFKNKDYKYDTVSNAFANLLGFKDRQDVVGKSSHEVYEESLAEKITRDEMPLLRGEVDTFEAIQEFPRPDGSMGWADMRKYPLKDRTGNVVGLIANVRDISARIEAERKLEEAFSVIEDSINYASRIQRSVLPLPGITESLFKDHFVIWEPRDTVGGDIYWCQPWGQGFLIALGDCTGHGVPGAFMTLIANGALEIALNNTEAGDCATLISNMNIRIKTVLSQDRSEALSDDGLEIAVCYIAPDFDKIHFAGARMSILIRENDEITELKGDKSSIGYKAVKFDAAFTNHILDTAGKQFYLLSDGLIDQPGGVKRRGFGKKRFKSILTQLDNTPLIEQRDILYDEFERYQGKEARRDDVSVIGFSL